MRINFRDAAGAVSAIDDAGRVKQLLAERAGLLWLDLERPSAEDFDFLSDVFGFHPLALEDASKRSQRPKIDEYNDYFFLVVQAVRRAPAKPFDLVELHFFVGPNYVVSLHGQDIPDYEQLFDPGTAERLMRAGSDLLIYELVDRAVDSFFPPMDRIDAQIDALEDEIVARPSQSIVNKLFTIKKELVMLRKVVGPQREVVSSLSRRDFVNIGDEASVYFRDVYDHLVRIYDMLDSSRDLLASALDVYLSTTSNHLNEVMKRLTVFASIFMPVTFIASVFGMNFLVGWFRYGSLFYVSLAAMFVVAVLNYYWFKWRKWL